MRNSGNNVELDDAKNVCFLKQIKEETKNKRKERVSNMDIIKQYYAYSNFTICIEVIWTSQHFFGGRYYGEVY